MNFNIQKLDNSSAEHISQVIDGKTKPLGALGQLEQTAATIAKVQLSNVNIAQPDLAQSDLAQSDLAQPLTQPLVITKPSLFIFAGDHGVAAEGVSIAPSEVTGQMVANFATGGAAINVFCRQLGWNLQVVDAGILTKPDESLGIISQRLGDITAPIHLEQAMSKTQVEQGFEFAKNLVIETKGTGCNLIAFGEMGIGNTTSASAIMSAFMNLPASETVGKGTGVSDDIVIKKQQVVEQALALHQVKIANPIDILACLGGFEIVQITGAMLAAAEQGMLIVVDGFICTAAAMAAFAINPNVRDYMIFAHCSGEQGHQKMLKFLSAEPLLNLGLRLGEGSGAALALPLIQASVGFYNEMASFAQADVTNVVEK